MAIRNNTPENSTTFDKSKLATLYENERFKRPLAPPDAVNVNVQASIDPTDFLSFFPTSLFKIKIIILIQF